MQSQTQKFQIIAVNKGMRIQAREKTELTVHPSYNIRMLQQVFIGNRGPPGKLGVQISFKGQKLYDVTKNITQFGIFQGSEVQFDVVFLRDIGVFDINLASPFRHLLVNNQAEDITCQEISQIIELHRGSNNPVFENKHINISQEKRQLIIDYINNIFEAARQSSTPQDNLEDFKIYLRRQQLSEMAGQNFLRQLQQLFGSQYTKIIFRRCEAHGKMIDFHTDYSKKTLQLCLNDGSEFIGGRLIYVMNDRLQIPKREVGAVTIHNNEIVHGVTLLKSGVRIGLFLLNDD